MYLRRVVEVHEGGVAAAHGDDGEHSYGGEGPPRQPAAPSSDMVHSMVALTDCGGAHMQPSQ